ncbi:hypothetical protein WJ07_17060 [Burkholderia vietnamiensis]|uniref:DUF3304 domain-containing protein n=1 Tax=Burkholderia vietnamiensis TaxID=60552 RepID=UPI000754C188|nr:DUF3304 domain-containing protein [Burkholderia vietnamiensis]KVF22569.1 hypothetical protein WJ07_17060 [Burkholderia vietnamiensis]
MTWRRFVPAVGLLAIALCLSACGKSESVYSGISWMGRNYLPYNMSGFTITDAYGNKASGGGDDPPGAGGGGLRCCYTLKGTEFTVRWKYYDVDQWHKGDKQMFRAEAKVSMPPSPAPDDAGSRIFEVHFFPDRHVEFQFPGQMLDDARLPIVDVVKWVKQYQGQLAKRYDEREDQQFRRVARIVASAWLKYRLTDRNDLEQFTYFSLLINRRFDTHPDAQRILKTAASQPGAFAKWALSLSNQTRSEVASGKFVAVAAPSIAAGLLPSARVDEALHD